MSATCWRRPEGFFKEEGRPHASETETSPCGESRRQGEAEAGGEGQGRNEEQAQGQRQGRAARAQAEGRADQKNRDLERAQGSPPQDSRVPPRGSHQGDRRA